jgi:hypothetical protein
MHDMTEPTVTPESVRARMAALDSSDPEEAHCQEDSLALEVLRAIADGHTQAQALAVAYLESYVQDRDRWYA